MAMQVVNPELPSGKTKTPISYGWHRMSVRVAKQLVHNTKELECPQRTQAPATVNKYAAEMRAKTWFIHTGDAVRLTVIDGIWCVIDGLHRVKSVITSGVPLDTWVAFDVPEEAFKHVDGGLQRDLKSLMSAADWPDPTILSVTGNMLFKASLGTGAPDSNVPMPAAGTVLDWLEDEEPDLHEHWDEKKRTIKLATRISKIPSAPLYYLWLKWSENNLEMADQIIAYLAEPTEIKPPNKLFMFAREETLKQYMEFQDFKAKGLNVNTNNARIALMEPLQFAWQQTFHSGKRILKPTGFIKALNAWKKSSEFRWKT